jgi:hypothetical protein
LLAATLIIPGRSSAAARSQSEFQAIVVQGTRDRDEQIQRFIKVLTPSYTHETLARFDGSVCPAVFGIAREQAAQVEERMRRVAAAVGIPVGKSGCIKNIALLVTSDKRALLKQLEEWPNMFPDDWSGATIRQFARDPSPAAAWQTRQMVWHDGTISTGKEISGMDMGSPLARPPIGAQPTHPLVAAHGVATRLQPSAHPAFVTAVVVVQANALVGLTATQLADYVAMRALVRTDPKRLQPSSQQSILSIIDAPMGTPVPLTLTAWDLSFLKAFYASRKDNYAETQRAEMKQTMRRELDQQQSDER